MAPVLPNYGYAFGDTGYVINADFGGNPNALPFFDVDSITGLDGAPPRVNTSDRSDRDGAFVSAPYTQMRTIVINGIVYANANDPETILDRLRFEYGPKRQGTSTPYGLPQYSPTATKPFWFQHPGKPLRFIMAQGGGCQYTIDTTRRLGQTPVQLTLLAGDPYIYDFPANDIMVGGNTQGPLNSNPYFETGLSPWTAVNSAAVVPSNTVAHEGYWSLRINGNGTVANPIARSENTIAVTAGYKFQATFNIYCVTAWASGCQCNIRWYNSAGVFLSTSTGTSSALAATAWTGYGIVATAPASAAFAQIDISILGTPPANQFFYADEAIITPAGGMTFPFSFAGNFGGPVQTIPSVTVFNNGTQTAWPTFTIYGPATNPVITDVLTWQTMPFNINLAAADILVVDTRNKNVVLHDGTVVPLPKFGTPVTDILVGSNFQDTTYPALRPGTKYTTRNARATLNGAYFFNVPSLAANTFYMSAKGTRNTTRFRVTMYNTYY
jgi:hypothetical protein